MFGKLTLLLVGLLALTSIVLAQSRRGTDDPEPPGSLIDIDTELGKEKEEVPEESGSGKDSDEEDDDDLEKSSGSGSGGYNTDTEEEKMTTTTKTLTPCQNLHEASKHLLGNYVPKCDENGDYGPMQCRGHASTGRCWCSDRNGAEIPGTAVDPPQELDCVAGKNLSPCLFQLVNYIRIRNPMFGMYRPRCKIGGEFEERQCHGSVCFCVDKSGGRKDGTNREISDSENMCMEEPHIIIPEKGVTIKAVRPTTRTQTEKPLPTKPNKGYDIPSSKTTTVNVELPEPEDDSEEKETESPNNTGDDKSDVNHEKIQAGHIMTQPGLLAAIIGGAVVGLLCAILLVMFIVYRMRKKDEGSYALDEPRKKSTYSPINQTDKEYYA